MDSDENQGTASLPGLSSAPHVVRGRAGISTKTMRCLHLCTYPRATGMWRLFILAVHQKPLHILPSPAESDTITDTEETLCCFVTMVTTKRFTVCDAYLITCSHRTYLNMKFSTNQYYYMGKKWLKVKIFHHAYG